MASKVGGLVSLSLEMMSDASSEPSSPREEAIAMPLAKINNPPPVTMTLVEDEDNPTASPVSKKRRRPLVANHDGASQTSSPPKHRDAPVDTVEYGSMELSNVVIDEVEPTRRDEVEEAEDFDMMEGIDPDEMAYSASRSRRHANDEDALNAHAYDMLHLVPVLGIDANNPNAEMLIPCLARVVFVNLILVQQWCKQVKSDITGNCADEVIVAFHRDPPKSNDPLAGASTGQLQCYMPSENGTHYVSTTLRVLYADKDFPHHRWPPSIKVPAKQLLSDVLGLAIYVGRYDKMFMYFRPDELYLSSPALDPVVSNSAVDELAVAAAFAPAATAAAPPPRALYSSTLGATENAASAAHQQPSTGPQQQRPVKSTSANVAVLSNGQEIISSKLTGLKPVADELALHLIDGTAPGGRHVTANSIDFCYLAPNARLVTEPGTASHFPIYLSDSHFTGVIRSWSSKVKSGTKKTSTSSTYITFSVQHTLSGRDNSVCTQLFRMVLSGGASDIHIMKTSYKRNNPLWRCTHECAMVPPAPATIPSKIQISTIGFGVLVDCTKNIPSGAQVCLYMPRENSDNSNVVLVVKPAYNPEREEILNEQGRPFYKIQCDMAAMISEENEHLPVSTIRESNETLGLLPKIEVDSTGKIVYEEETVDFHSGD